MSTLRSKKTVPAMWYFWQEGRGRIICVRADSKVQAVCKLANAWWSKLDRLCYEAACAYLDGLGVKGPLEIEEVG